MTDKNTVLDLLMQQKSVRVYEDRAIAPDQQEAIFQAALHAPTAGNMTLYSILNITDQEIKNRLSETCDNQPFIAGAPFVLVFCADYRRWMDTFQIAEEMVRKPGEGDFLLAVSDTLIAAQNAVIAAGAMGIGSCYIGDILENYEIHRELLHLPKYVAPVCMVCFGYPTVQQLERKKPGRFQIRDIVMENSYQMKSEEELLTMLKEKEETEFGEIGQFIHRFCERKWNCDFSREMTRSVKAMIEEWVK